MWFCFENFCDIPDHLYLDKFPRCSFESGTCEWTSNKNEAGEEWWQRNTSHILNVGENMVGPESDFEGHEDGENF